MQPKKLMHSQPTTPKPKNVKLTKKELKLILISRRNLVRSLILSEIQSGLSIAAYKEATHQHYAANAKPLSTMVYPGMYGMVNKSLDIWHTFQLWHSVSCYDKVITHKSSIIKIHHYKTFLGNSKFSAQH